MSCPIPVPAPPHPNTHQFILVWVLVSSVRWSEKLSEISSWKTGSSSGWHQAQTFPSSSMWFWRKLQFLGAHCFNSLIARRKGLSLVSKYPFPCQDCSRSCLQAPSYPTVFFCLCPFICMLGWIGYSAFLGG